MRYFIGNLIRGEAAEFYKATCSDLKNRFGVEDVSLIVAPHITVKSPFEKNNIEAVDDCLALATDMAPFPLQLSGWNHFTTRTIFLDAPEHSPQLRDYIKDILSKLSVLGLPLSPQEQNPHIHLSVARFLTPDQYKQVTEYLSSIPAPTFDINFDNLTIFVKEKKEDKSWHVLKTFPLIGKK